MFHCAAEDDVQEAKVSQLSSCFLYNVENYYQGIISSEVGLN